MSGTTVETARGLLRMPEGKRRAIAAAGVLHVLSGAAAPTGGRPVAASTAAARSLRQFQKDMGLPATGTADDTTVARLVAAASHQHVAGSAYRTAKAQELLATAGFPPDTDDASRRAFGDSTVEAVRRFQRAQGLVVDGVLGDTTQAALREAALTQRLSSKRQTAKLQRVITRAARIRGVDVTIDPAEISARTAGDSTAAAVRALQTSLGLPVTGEMDTLTYDRLTAVAASRRAPAPRVGAPDPADLALVLRQLRLNATNKDVPGLQRALAFLGHPPVQTELAASRFGPSTRQAVIAFQAAHGLPQTGAADGPTLKVLNASIRKATPGPEHAYRIRGAVRDTTWAGRGDVTVELAYAPAVGVPVVLATRRTLSNGFYDLPYSVPKDKAGQPIQPLSLRVRFLTSNGTVLGTKTATDPSPITWINLTEGAYPYRGTSLYDAQVSAVNAAGATDLTTIMETADRPEVSAIARAAGMSQDDVMRLILASRAARELPAALDARVCFAFLAQSLPATLPSDLLAQTDEWTLIDHLTDVVASGISATPQEVAHSVLQTALEQNLVPVALASGLDEILAGLDAARLQFALDRPLLVGNASLRSVLERSTIPTRAFDEVARTFVATGGIAADFWKVLEESPATYGGEAAVASLRHGFEVGAIAKNFTPMVDVLTNRTARELAKLSPQQWTDLVVSVGSVPDGIGGRTLLDQQQAYARTMAAQAQRLYPTVAVTAAVKRTGAGGLSQLATIERLVDDHPDFELRTANVDTYLAEKSLHVNDETRSELKVLQRIHRLAASVDGATALLDKDLHSSVQIVSLGREGFVARMTEAGLDAAAAVKIHSFAQTQYAQVLQRLTELRSEVQSTLPFALSPLRLSAEDRAELLADVPDVELLFGPLDSCDCPHCESIYGPAAYLADVFRFLDSHRADAGDGTVLDVLRARRPDLTKVQLTCENTETVMPFIDLANEVLEAVFPGSAGRVDLQTTLPTEELRAAPEHQDDSVYEILRTADLPLVAGYDLYADQIRVLLSHLGVPRWRLMQTLAPQGNAAEVAAEYFGISVHEAGLIMGANPSSAAQSALWGFDATRDSIPVLEVMNRVHLTYPQLLLLLQSQWLTPDGDPRLHIQRPADSADLHTQTLEAVSPAVLDRMHRFLRLAHHTPWDSWELDLLLRAPRLAAGTLDDNGLIALHGAAMVAERLRIGAEQLVTWFGDIPMQGRPNEADPTKADAAAPSRYRLTFGGRNASGAFDPAFHPQPDGSTLHDHREALLAALAVSDAALGALLNRTGTTNNLRTLSTLLAWAELARAVRMDLAELLLAADLLAPVVADPFVTPSAMLKWLDALDLIRGAGVPIAEQDYLLGVRPQSPLAPSPESIEAQITALREVLRSNPDDDPAGAVIAATAATTGLLATQIDVLLGLSDDTGVLREALTALSSPEASAVVFTRATGAYRRVLKMARVVASLRLSDEDLHWLVANPDAVGLRLTLLPVDTAPVAPLGAAWLRLQRWARVRRDLLALSRALATTPGKPPAVPQTTCDQLMSTAGSGAAIADVRMIARTLTGLDVDTLAALDTGLKAQYADPEFLHHLVTAATAVKRLGVSAATAAAWAVREHTGGPTERELAAAVMSAAKSKHDRAAWLSVLTPLQDTWRERKRDALVAYLLEHSVRTAGAPDWTSPDDLLTYLLIDVQTSACALTSRIKQAISSTQMFVQRAFLNLEKPQVVITAVERADGSSADAWRQWKWMKNYRVWEANRKIFLYPENWIAPELRDDKTPFFLELEQEIGSGEITAHRCEDALRTYLDKLNAVANLAVVGVHHEIDGYAEDGPTVNVLHVIGRTRGTPYKHYYRSYDINAALWSPWEPIDLDISGEQVLPVVYNRMLHLFWLQMESKPQKKQRQPAAAASSGTSESPEVPTQVELKLSWTVRRGGGWVSPQTAPDPLIHPWPRPTTSYSLKPRYRPAENQLALDVYITMSPEFNANTFWDPMSGGRVPLGQPFSATSRAWHSSSFIFDGHVIGRRVKALARSYRLLDNSVVGNSFDYVKAVAGAQDDLRPMTGGSQVSARIATPEGMRLRAGRMVNNTWTGNDSRLTVLSQGGTVTLLVSAPGPFSCVHSLHRIQPDTALDHSPFVYVDASRSYVVTPASQQVRIDSSTSATRQRFTFAPFSHPYAPLFLRELNRSGPDGLINRRLQRTPQAFAPPNNFAFSSYGPVHDVASATPEAEHDVLDFSRSGSMSGYNWEVFFHIPFLIGCKLAANQRFEEALQWFGRIFDPTNTEGAQTPQRFWITKPFYEATDADYQKSRVEKMLANANDPQVAAQIAQWRNHPFMPDVIARFRPVAYQKAIVMRYIDVLVDFGDQLFRRDTIESINEATLLYVLAGEMLGRRPERVPRVPRDGKSYDDLTAQAELDRFGNQQVEVQLENLGARPTLVIETTGEDLPVVKLGYFGIPANDDLLDYWERVADRLFKIRHCMNIAGTVRQLPLFEPPIDPALLVRAAAAGVDIDSVLNDTAASGSPYRYATLFAAAMSAASDVRALGERMLAALQRRDEEALERLRAGNELAVGSLVKQVRETQVREAQSARQALEASLDSVHARIEYYASRPLMNDLENSATTLHSTALAFQITSTVMNTIASAASLVPNFEVGASGFGGSPVASAKYGGTNVSDAMIALGKLFDGLSSILHGTGSLLETQAGYQRRFEEHQFQAEQSRKELTQLTKQVITAKVREAVAEHELEAHLRSVENARGVEEFLKTKYTGEQLFDWLVGQLSTVYFQAYQLAFDLARRAERAYRFEVGDQTSASIVTFGYWDSLKRGLLAGDRLVNDLRRLDSANLSARARRLQATTHISLASLMPDKLLELKSTGTTSIEISEWMLARENPGWFNQRLMSVAVTAPCVTGPYTGLHAQVTLTSAVVRTDGLGTGGFDDAFGGDPAFAAAMPAVTSIRTSHGVEDQGRVPSARADDRYGAFEGAGAISRWTITLDPRDNAFDVSTLSDFVLTLELEGDQGSQALVDAARAAVDEALPDSGAVLLWLDGMYAGPWSRFLNPVGGEQVLSFDLGADALQYLYRQLATRKRLTVTGADLVLEASQSFDVRFTPPGGAAVETLTSTGGVFGANPTASATWAAGTRDLLGTWRVQLKASADLTWDALPDDAVRRAWLLLRFAGV